MSDEFGINKTLQTEAVDRLQDWNWPGNLRELIFVIRRLFVNADSNEITVSEVSTEISKLQNDSSEDKKTSLGQSAKYHIEKYFNSIGDDLPSSGLFDKILREVEKTSYLCYNETNIRKSDKGIGNTRYKQKYIEKKIKQLNLPLSRDGYK